MFSYSKSHKSLFDGPKVPIEVGKVRMHADRAAGFFNKKSIYDFLSYFQFQTDLFSFFQKIIAYSNSHNVKKTLT